MSDFTKPSLCIIGGGRAGASLAFYLLRRGYPLTALFERNPDRIAYLEEELGWSFVFSRIEEEPLRDARIIIISIHDDQIGEMAEALSEKNINWNQKIVVHTSGAHPSGILDAVKKKGARVGSIHPVYSFALDPRENHRFNEVWFNIEGEEEALQVFEDIFSHSTNTTIRVSPGQKKAIHLASVFYSNFYVGLANASRELLENDILQGQDVFKMLNPLLHSSIEQVTQQGPVLALTGPIKRGDVSTIKTHLEQIKSSNPALLGFYVCGSKMLLEMSGLGLKETREISALLESYLDSSA